MRRYLRHDASTGALLLVLADLWQGEHEITEYPVVGESGQPVRNQPDLDGAAVDYAPGAYGARYCVRRPGRSALWLAVDPSAVEPMRFPCRIAANPRNRRCDWCAA